VAATFVPGDNSEAKGAKELAMPEIIVNDEEAREILAAKKQVPVMDSKGNLVGLISPQVEQSSVDYIDELLLRRYEEGEGRYTTDEVLFHIRQLGQNLIDGRNAARKRLDENPPPDAASP
jgi:hypothetical protein